MCLKHSRMAFALLSLLPFAGCSSMNGMNNMFPATGDKPIKIESVPTGTAVYVLGEKIGVTPLDISQKNVFPNIYPKEKESEYGKVILKKEGCQDFIKVVSTEIINAGLRAQLNCKNASTASSSASGDVPPHANESIEQRLDKIKVFLSKGLITEEEANKARERILNDL